MNKNVKVMITALSIIVLAIFGSTVLEWHFDKDFTTLSRNGEDIAKSKFGVEAERTYINQNTWYRRNVMCPKIIEAGGYETETRCYYPKDTYEPLSRSLLNTKITVDEFYDEILITKTTPHYKYGTRGAYAGKVIESMLFDEATKHEEDFPKDYSIDWTPTDTRNYKLVWRLEKLTHNYADGSYKACSYTFNHVKVDLLDNCKDLDRVEIANDKAYFYFDAQRGQQNLNLGFVDPPIEEVIKQIGLQITHNSDTKGSVVQNEEPFHISIDTSTVQHGWVNKSDNTTRYAIYGKGLFWTDDAEVPNGTKYFGISFGEKATTGWIKHKNALGSTWSTINSVDFKHLNSYTFDNNKTYDDVYYTTFATIPSNHTRDFKLYIELLDKPKRDNFIIYFGTGSTVLEVDIGTDLKVVQTGLSNTTDYTASIDVSEGKLFKSQTDSDYDLTDGLVGWWSFDNGNYSGSWGTTSYDYSGNNNHGTLTNMNTGLDNGTSGWTANGNLSYGINFDSVNDYVDCGSDTSLDITGALTISAWLKTTDITQQQLIFTRGLFNTYGYYFQIFTSKLYFTTSQTGTSQETKSTINPFSSNVWHHVVVTRTGTTVTFYVDGSEITYDVQASHLDPLTSGIISYIGRYSPSVANFNGTIDDVRIWNVAKSATEIEALYNLTVSKYETKITELSSSAVTYDVISNSNTSAIVNVPEIDEDFMFTPTYIRCNMSSSTNNTCFNTTDNSWFGQETVTVTESYLDEANLTRVRVTNPFDVGIYDLYLFNLTEYLSWNPNNLLGVWYDSYTGNSDNSTLKDTSDWSQWVDTYPANDSGLVGYWNFNELDGTIAKDRANNSANNNDGTLTNMNTGVDNASSGWTREGKYGNALEFDGTNDYVITSSFSITPTNYTTISMWFNPAELINSSTSTSYLMHSVVGGDNFHLFWNPGWSANGELKFLYYTDGTNIQAYSTATSWNANTWYHVVITYDKSNTRMYINGILNQTHADTEDLNTTTATVGIGAKTYGNELFNGTIDEVKIFNVAKDQAWITAEYERSKDYFDSITLEEGAISASANQDYFLTNGSIENPQIDFVSPTETNDITIIVNYTYINWTATDNNLDTVIFNWNGANTTMSNNYINKTSLDEGTYTYYVWANDTLGLTNQTETRTITIDWIDAGTLWIKPLLNLTSSLWMISFGRDGGNVSAYDDSCGTITTHATESVNTFKNGSVALSYSSEFSSMGNSEKQRFSIYRFPRHFEANTFRIFFQIVSNLTENIVTQVNMNITEILDRTGINNTNTSTYRLYRVNRGGGVYNDSGVCYETEVSIGD